MLLAVAALLDIIASGFGINRVLEIGIWLLAAYAVLNIVDYSWTYLRSDRIERDLATRL